MKLPFWATTLTFCGLLILCSLGVWQLQRLQWKSGLLAEIAAERKKEPMAFELNYDNLRKTAPGRTVIRAFAEGIYLHEHEIALGPRTHKGKPGLHIITPFETLDNHILLVNRGWVPLEKKESGFARPEGPVIITGAVRRPPGAGLFRPANVPAENEWYSLAPEEIAQAKKLDNLLPWVFYPDSGGVAEDYPLAAAVEWRPANNHLAYALFWFAMAGTLLIIYYLRFIRKP